METNRKKYFSLIIRKGELADAHDIKSIMDESFAKYVRDAGLLDIMKPIEESLESIQKDIRLKDVFIAFADDIPVGSARVEIFEDKTAYISRFGVKPQYHNIGIGKSIMNHIDNLLISQDVKRIYLHTASNYRTLVHFYYERGFYIDEVSKDGGYPRALMIKEY